MEISIEVSEEFEFLEIKLGFLYFMLSFFCLKPVSF